MVCFDDGGEDFSCRNDSMQLASEIQQLLNRNNSDTVSLSIVQNLRGHNDLLFNIRSAFISSELGSFVSVRSPDRFVLMEGL